MAPSFNKLKWVLLITGLLLAHFIYAQNEIENALKVRDEQFPQEKIHLFLNKESYAAGETIWFKAYLFSGYAQSYISTNLYVELYNSDKQVIDRTLVPLSNSIGPGSIYLPSNLREGFYYIRAYTKWMLNFDQEFEYTVSLPIYNANSKKSVVKKEVKWEAEVFPESGTILSEEPNKIAVRLKAIGSLPDKWEGFVIEKNKPYDKLATFHSYNSQIASLTFTPSTGKEYSIVIEDDSGNKTTKDFRHSPSGVALRAKQVNQQIWADLIFKNLPEGGMDYHFLAHQQGQLVYSSVIKKKESKFRIILPINNLMTGVLNLSIFDKHNKVVAERLVFVGSNQLSDPNLNLSLVNTSPRGLNKWEVNIDSVILSSYACSVTDAEFTPSRYRSIYSDLWLSDFSNNINDPNWYFTTSDSSKIMALDALLISEKWKRFYWDDLINGTFPKITCQPEKYLTYKGTMFRDNKIVKSEDISLMVKFKDSSLQFFVASIDTSGHFFINNVAFYDTAKLFYQPKSKKLAIKNTKLQVELINQFAPLRGKLPDNNFIFTEQAGNPLQSAVNRNIEDLKSQRLIQKSIGELDEVKIQTTVKSATSQLNEKLSSALFNTEQETVFDLINGDYQVTQFNNIFDWLDGRVAGLLFRIKNDQEIKQGESLIRVGQRIPMMRDQEVALFLDEIPTDLDAIYSLPPAEIALVKVFKGYFLGANSGGAGGGAIAVYTKNGKTVKFNQTPNLPNGEIAGYRNVPIFRNINYASSTSQTNKDNRYQLFWTDRLLPDENGKAWITFSNNDITTSYHLVITAFTKYARPIFIEIIIRK